MSHLPERKDKNCLNCGTVVVGRFCHRCGQENLEPKESVWHLLSHFFNDITHFDGKVFSSLKLLIIKPGFLSREYVKGRRASYLNPIRLYLLTSAFFFLIFFSSLNIDEKGLKVNFVTTPPAEQINKMDSNAIAEVAKQVNGGKSMTRKDLIHYFDSLREKGFHLTPGPKFFHSREEYDSVLKSRNTKDGWFVRQLVYRDIELNQKFNSDPKKIIPAMLAKFLHSIPQMLFFLLPLFALILKLVYVRRDHYYVDHLIFTLHLYVFTFIAILVTMLATKVRDWLHWEWFKYVGLAVVLSTFFYFYKALRNFYRQRRLKTIVKFFILLFLFMVTTVILFAVFFFLSIFNV